MHGGLLSSNSLITIPELDLLIAAYSHQIYLFSIQQATITDKIALHQNPIIQLHYNQTQKIVYALDREGLLCSFRVGEHKIIEQLQKYKISKKGGLRQAKFRNSPQAEVQIIAVNQNGSLTRHVGEFEYLIDSQISKILMMNRDFLVIGKESNNNNEICIFSSNNLEKLYEYDHICEVTGVQQYENNLIIADSMGKITILIDYLSKGQIKLRQRLQWHVHRINTIKINGSYLYSGGQQGVIVLWHLRQNKKDYLPRIGSQIYNLQLQQSKIYCFLSDNTIKSIDLNNDKSLLHYKIIVNPHHILTRYGSIQKINNTLIRVSNKYDKIYLRSFLGKIQQINLYNGINTQYNIINRNYVSRLDDQIPSPHQITDICLTKNNDYLAVAIEGINTRSIKFYQLQNNNILLVSKVQNCHQGNAKINLLSLHQNGFISYCKSDKNIKIWKLTNRKKDSILQIQDQFWCCEYYLSFRQQYPRFVSISGNKAIVTFQSQFIIFDIGKQVIEEVYNLQYNNSNIIGVYRAGSNNKYNYLQFYESEINIIKIQKNMVECNKLLEIKGGLKIRQDKIYYNEINLSFSVLVQDINTTHIYYYLGGKRCNHIEIDSSIAKITDLFWIKDRLIAIDSTLFFYDLTHEKQLLQLQNQQKISYISQSIQMQNEDQIKQLNYNYLFNNYMQRQYRKDKHTIQQNNEILGITPLISSSFEMLAANIFL